MANKNSILIIIIILTIIFFSLIFVSTSQKGITVNYTFKDEVTVNSIDNQLTSTIGSVEIQNQAFLTKRVKLENYVLCLFNENIVDKTFEVYYSGDKTNRYQQDIFLNYNTRSIDISSNDKSQLDMKVNRYIYDVLEDIKQYNLNNQTIDFYLFKTEETSDNYYNYYNYCNQVNKENAIKTIKVKFEINQEELENNRIESYENT